MASSPIALRTPLSPYLGPDPESPVISKSARPTPSTFMITPAGRPGARDRVSTVGMYKLGRTLGKGSCGVVKLGTHLETGHKVAVKVLRPKNDRERNEIQREIAALQQLNHPNIIHLIQVIRGSELQSSSDPTSEKHCRGLDKYIFMVLELATGGELFEKVLQGGPLSENEARTHMRSILSALSYTHAHLICHRDLKPENILFDSDGNVKISDFGLSNTSRAGKLFSTWCGSPMYAPPEVVMEQKYKGWAVDVWSLGIILYVMVTGGMPWRLERGQVRDMELFLGGVYAVPNDMGISNECVDILDKMIQSNPLNRASLRELCTHPWVTDYGALPPPDPLLTVPRNATLLLTQQSASNGLKYIVDEQLLFQVQEVLGFDRQGMVQARQAIQRLLPCPALTAYCILAYAQATSVTMMVPTEALPSYMRHRRLRSEIPRSSPLLAMQTPSLLNPPTESIEGKMLVLGGDKEEELDGASSNIVSCSPTRSRASTAPAAYNKIAAHHELMTQDISPETSPRDLPGVALDLEDDSKPHKSRRESTKHVLRTLVLKLK